jgi:hypothetical protein
MVYVRHSAFPHSGLELASLSRRAEDDAGDGVKMGMSKLHSELFLASPAPQCKEPAALVTMGAKYLHIVCRRRCNVARFSELDYHSESNDLFAIAHPYRWNEKAIRSVG